jgi:hypothetical protein
VPRAVRGRGFFHNPRALDDQDSAGLLRTPGGANASEPPSVVAPASVVALSHPAFGTLSAR